MAIPASTTIALHNRTLSKAAPGTLLDALQRRRTAREFSPEELNDRHLSQLLWAAYGINRIDGRRTAPAAMGIYALRIYAILPDGIYSYRPEGNELIEILAGDFRGFSGKQYFVADAPLNIVIYADYKAFRTGDPKVDEVLSSHEGRMAALDAGAVTENVYLYCASEGINVVERMLFDDNTFRGLTGLPESYNFMVAMTVGYPKVSVRKKPT